jgi:Lon protease-like protein
MRSERIPLFPLEVVLFPRASLPLHIFEPRYKLMVGRCLQSHKEFGVILSRAEGIARIGCTAEIVKVLKKYPDGRMDILAIGQTRYRVQQVFEEQPYLEGDVEYLEDALVPGSEPTQKRLLELYEKCHALVYGRSPGSPEASDETSLAFCIANELPMDLDWKQELLEIRAEPERQTRLVEQLNRWLRQLQLLERMRVRAGGNGHGLP